MVDLVKQWKEAARRDDLFDHMVPSDVRQLIGEIERLRAVICSFDDLWVEERHKLFLAAKTSSVCEADDG